MSPFAVDYCNLDAVIAFAKAMAKRNPKFTQYVVKNPNRDNYNITMNLAWAVRDGSQVIWSSSESN